MFEAPIVEPIEVVEGLHFCVNEVMSIGEASFYFHKHYNTVFMRIQTGALDARQIARFPAGFGEKGSAGGTYIIETTSLFALWGRDFDEERYAKFNTELKVGKK